ncbi:PCI domain-containing protein [Mycena floridula]|nr:PCI domain-containing protein [Mycena floridula]
MASTDSVSVFAEGTFEEQIQELVNYIVRGLSEEERTSFIRPFQEALKTPDGATPFAEDEGRRRKVFVMVIQEVKGLGEGSEREIEGFFNLLYSHLFALYSSTSPELKAMLTDLLATIASAPSEHASIKYRILSNLFNAIPMNSPLRLAVYRTLLDVATAQNGLDVLQLSRAGVEKWLQEWDISSEEKSDFFKAIVNAYAKSGDRETSYEYLLSYLRSLPPKSEAAQKAAVDAIASSIRLPSAFNFDSLFKLEAIVAAKDHELFSLLRIFLNDGLPEFRAWAASHPDAFKKYDLDQVELERKIRLLTLASLGFKNIGQNLPYSKVAEALQVDLAEVEIWIIDVIRTGLVSGKMSQTTQSLHIARSTARLFEREQWEALEKRITAWQTGLNDVLRVLADAKKQGGAITSLQPQTVAV